jgi:hypothetical protein
MALIDFVKTTVRVTQPFSAITVSTTFECDPKPADWPVVGSLVASRSRGALLFLYEEAYKTQ